MTESESVEALSEVLSNLQDMADAGGPASVHRQIDVLRAVQTQMKTQLKIHDAQIAALREVIDLLKKRAKS